MRVFEVLKAETFFRPLTSPRKQLYVDVLELLVDKSVQYIPLLETDAKRFINLYLTDADVVIETVDNDDELDQSESDSAAQIVAYLTRNGWLNERERQRDFQYSISITKPAMILFRALKQICPDSENTVYINYISSMLRILTSEADMHIKRERPYSAIVEPLSHETLELKQELTSLLNNIKEIILSITEANSIKEIGEWITLNITENKYFEEYFYIKDNGYIPVYITQIKRGIREFSRGELRFRAAEEYARKAGCTKEDGLTRVEDMINSVESFLTYEYDELIQEISLKINDYYQLADIRIRILLDSTRENEDNAKVVLEELSARENDGKEVDEKFLNEFADLANLRLLNRDSIRIVSESSSREPIPFDDAEFSAEDIEHLTQAVYDHSYNPYSKEAVSGFLKSRMGGKSSIEGAELKADQIEDVFMIASAMSAVSDSDFGYELELGEGRFETDTARIINFVIKERSNG